MSKANFCIRSSIIYRKKFLFLSMTAQALYFHLNCDADQDGIVAAYATLQRTGCKPNDLIQLAPNFITVLDEEECVVYINHWIENNPGLDIRWHDGSEYLPLLAEKIPNAKVMVRIPFLGKNNKGEETIKYKKQIMTALEAIAKKTNELDLLCEDSMCPHRDHDINRNEQKQIEPNPKEDNSIGEHEWIKNSELLKSRGLNTQQAQYYASKYSESQLLKYISYVNCQPNVHNKVAFLTAALKNEWNIDQIVTWNICDNCNGEAFTFVDSVPYPCPICQGKGKIPKRKE